MKTLLALIVLCGCTPATHCDPKLADVMRECTVTVPRECARDEAGRVRRDCPALLACEARVRAACDITVEAVP